MLGTCYYIKDNYQRCSSTFNLHNILFRDPYSPGFIQSVDICELHYRYLIEELMGDQKDKQRKIEKLRYEIATYKKVGKENDIYYDTKPIYAEIEQQREFIKYQLNNECKNIFCRKNLSILNKGEKLYSVTTFSQNGKRHYTFYFCSLKCYNIMKGKCGIATKIHSGQLTL